MNRLEALGERLLAEHQATGRYFRFQVVLDETGLAVNVEGDDGERCYEVGLPYGARHFLFREVTDPAYSAMAANDVVAIFFPAACAQVH